VIVLLAVPPHSELVTANSPTTVARARCDETARYGEAEAEIKQKGGHEAMTQMTNDHDNVHVHVHDHNFVLRFRVPLS
jgi:hypothetical protein